MDDEPAAGVHVVAGSVAEFLGEADAESAWGQDVHGAGHAVLHHQGFDLVAGDDAGEAAEVLEDGLCVGARVQ